MNRDLQIGICGTFDVKNYGDLLFPLIAEAELSRRLGRVKLHRFSYSSKTPPDWPYAVSSLADLPAEAGSLDGMIIGGGHLIRFDKEVAPGYEPPTPAIHHPTGYWLTPALIGLQHGIPVVWNAPGVHGGIPAWAEPLMQLAITLSRYVALRDEPSKQALERFAGDSKIAVVPDTAFGVAQLRDPGQPSPDFARLRETLGIKSRYIVVQATSGLEAFLRLVREHPNLFHDVSLVVLPVGPILGDGGILFENGLPRAIHLPMWPHPLVLAELIGQASAVVGISLHMAITALAFGVPVFRPDGAFAGKYEVLSGFDTVFRFTREAAIDPEWFAARLGRAEPSPAVRDAVRQLSDHWDKVAAALNAREENPAAIRALANFWQSIPNGLEAWSVRCTAAAVAERNAAVSERDAAIADRDRQITALNELLAATLAKVTARDKQLEALYDSTYWKITAPFRSLGRAKQWQKAIEEKT